MQPQQNWETGKIAGNLCHGSGLRVGSEELF